MLLSWAYLAAVFLVALGVWAGYGMFETSLGEALCDSGDCSGPSSKPELLLALMLVSFLGAGIVGRLAWRKENRDLEPQDRDGVGATGFLAVCIALVGLLLGAGAVLLTHPD